MEMILLLFAFGAVCFVIQLALCRKVSPLPVRLLPCFLILAGTVYSTLLALGVFGTYSAGMLENGHLLEALFYFVFLAAAAIGTGTAWITSHFLMKKDP